jgi:hypothetical protein
VRRKFLADALAGVVGGAAAHPLVARAQADTTNACGLPYSVADSLEQYERRLHEVQLSVYKSLMTDLGFVARGASDLLLKLKSLVNELSKELKKNPAKPTGEQARQLHKLVTVGQAQFVQALALVQSSGAALQLAAPLEVLTESAGREAANLLPAGPASLSKEALRIINEILNEIRSSGQLQKELSEAEERSRTAVNVFNTLMQPLKEHIRKAGEHALVAESPVFPQADRDSERGKALEELKDALSQLTELKDNLAKLKKSYEISGESEAIFRLVEALLRGTTVWLKAGAEPSLMGTRAGGVSLPGGARVIAASAGTPRAWDNLNQGYVKTLFDRWCLPGSALQVDMFFTRTLVSLDWDAWSRTTRAAKLGAKFFSGLAPYTEGELYNLIMTDFLFNKTECRVVDQNVSRTYRPDSDQLARQLAKYIFDRNR